MRACTRSVAVGALGLLVAALLAGCSASTSGGGNPSSARGESTPSSTQAPRQASGARLPLTVDGWSPTASPSAQPTEIDNVRVREQIAVYRDSSGQESRIVALVVSSDKGYAQSQRKGLDSPQDFGLAVCGVPDGVPNAVSCIIELSGGLLQTTGTGDDVAGLAAFTNSLYARLG